MAELLFITPAELTAGTVIGGNVDVDKYTTTVASVQITVIEPLLGSELYDYIIDNYATLTGDYLTLLNEFIKPITKNQSVAEYIEICSIMLDNGGLYKHVANDREIVSKDDTFTLSQKYHSIADMYIQRFNKWICKNTIAEYKMSQDEVNASKNVKLTGGLWFGNDYEIDWRIDESNV